jgi:polyisoprenoid-binding protein YceI
MSIIENTPRTSVPTRWVVDPERSSVEFAVKTFWGLVTVRGRFERYDGWYDATPDRQSIELSIDAGSLNTEHGKRDEHLRSADFFDIADHPEVRFISTRVRNVGDGTLHVEGGLEAAGVVVAVEFDAEARQVGEELEVEARTTVDPRRFGMSSGHVGMIPPPARLHITVRLTEATAQTKQEPVHGPARIAA